MANTTIGYPTVQKYLTGLATLNGAIGGSPHKAFWVNMTYDQFMSANVPHVSYHGAPVPIVWKAAPLLSPLFMILIEPGGWGGFPQMPMDGPFITDDNLQIPVDNTTVSGKQVREDLEVWFRNGCPKDPMPIPGP